MQIAELRGFIPRTPSTRHKLQCGQGHAPSTRPPPILMVEAGWKPAPTTITMAKNFRLSAATPAALTKERRQVCRRFFQHLFPLALGPRRQRFHAATASPGDVVGRRVRPTVRPGRRQSAPVSLSPPASSPSSIRVLAFASPLLLLAIHPWIARLSRASASSDPPPIGPVLVRSEPANPAAVSRPLAGQFRPFLFVSLLVQS